METIQNLKYRLHFSGSGELNYGEPLETSVNVLHIKSSIEDNNVLGEHLETHFRVQYSQVELSDNHIFGVKGEFCLIGYFAFDASLSNDDLNREIEAKIPGIMWQKAKEYVVYNVEMYGIQNVTIDFSDGKLNSLMRRVKRNGQFRVNSKIIS